MSPLRLAVIGVGHLGKEHARVLSNLSGVKLVGVADTNAEQAHQVASRFGAKAYTDYHSLVTEIDAASIAVPTIYHHEVAKEFLQLGIPLMVEKPLAATVAEAEDLVRLAQQNGALLQVGHIERFNPAFEELQRRPVQPKFVNVERVGPFTGRSTDIGVVLDLMIHDLDLLLELVASSVESVEAVGVSVFQGHEDIVNARLRFANGCVANVTASRASSAAGRSMQVWSPEGYACVDFRQRQLALIQPSEQLRRSGLDVTKLDSISFARLKDDLFGLYLKTLHLDCNKGDPLTRELSHFVSCVHSGRQPRVTGKHGLKALILADRVLESLRTHRWEGRSSNFVGPSSLPEPLAPLFPVVTSEAA